MHTTDCDGPEHCDTATCDCCNRDTHRCHITRRRAGTLETYACCRCAAIPCDECTPCAHRNSYVVGHSAYWHDGRVICPDCGASRSYDAG